MKSYLMFLALMVTCLYSCEKEETKGAEIKNDPALAAELKASPEAIVIGNNSLLLETYLWRDFMPDGNTGGSALFSVNKLTGDVGAAIPESISLKKQYVIKGDEIWISDYSEVRNSPANVLEGVVRDGPEWGPDINVDVVCEFEREGQTFRILAKSQKIHATY